MIERLDHVALLTPDAERAARFYGQWAGMRVIHERQDEGSTHRVRWVRLASDEAGLIIVLVEAEARPPGGQMDHFGFHVTAREEVDTIAARAREAGILVEGPTDAGPVVGYYCMIRDPDGNLLEFSCEQLRA
jgi:catechol 2,3-dioxygenase-like lactoylglutathione lyase family enzyme